MALVYGAELCAAPAAGALPDAFIVTPLAQRTQINGVDINIRAVSSAITAERACSLAAREWSRAGQGIASGCTREGAWLLVSRRMGSAAQTLQLQPAADGSVGFLSELDLAARPGRPPVPQLPLPSGARVTEVVRSTDARDVIVQFAVRVPAAPAATVRRLIARAREHGWAISARPGMLDFRRGPVAVRGIVGHAAGGSSIVLLEHHAVRPR